MDRLRRITAFGVVLSAVVLLSAHLARAEVARVEIDRRESFADGHSFGRSGPYEKLSGRLHLEVDPLDPANQRVTDLKLAPRNARGKVECWTDFFLLKPVDSLRGNRRVLYDVNNRGNKLAVWTFNGTQGNNPTTLADAGNGFLMHQGYSILWCGWCGDVTADGTDRLLMGLPVARDGDKPITGRIHVEICVDEKVQSRPFFWSPWGTADAYPAASLDNKMARLTMRPKRSEPAVEVPRDAWALARMEDGKLVPDPKQLYVEDGFRPGWLYDLVYTGKEPRVAGLGLAAIRDCVSFFRYADEDRQGFQNPLAGSVEYAYVFGISQSGRVVHHFLYDGFNADETGRVVFDGCLAHVAGAGKGLFNHRFGMATVYGIHHQGNLYPSEFFPFTPMPQKDPVTGHEGDTLARARAQGHVPKMIFTQTSTEYWARAASLLHTDVEGKRDLELDPNLRIYSVAGAQHLGAGPPDRGTCQNPRNILDDRPPVLRAMLVALDRWVGEGRQPPASRYPRIADGTLVGLDVFRGSFPHIPGVRLPEGYYMPLRLDFGPRWYTEGIADFVPPKPGPPYQTLVPAADADGNELAGIRLPDVAVPLGTFTGWNLRAAEYGAEGMLGGLHGSYLPFARTPDERSKQGDPRPSVLERYPTRAVYLARMTEAALQLEQEGFLLEADVVEILKTASTRRLWDDAKEERPKR
ncbi:MAG: alpha/beta hydrolase domain-containing protein [Planctomycetota bacterium]